MFASTFWGVTLSLVALRNLVAGDPTSVLTMHSIKVTNNPNDYFDPWSVDITEGKRATIITINIPAKKDVPENLQLRFYGEMDGQDPVEYSASFCECMEEETIGKGLVGAGIPKSKFPKKCPVSAGNWTIFKWNPPVDMIPVGFPEGKFRAFTEIMEEGIEPYVRLDYEGELSHELPTLLGR